MCRARVVVVCVSRLGAECCRLCAVFECQQQPLTVYVRVRELTFYT
jgi:hypothetical protein